jgi:hypothetical protein
MYSMELGGLAKYSKYSITVLAYNAVGPGPNSLPEVLVTTLEDGKQKLTNSSLFSTSKLSISVD